ncbi:hypothetical protein, conserved [Eimeria maxima]|uniref:Uncharacterized protein n=1 Tax=Eimeria maxima TaxID=5804 RepID=U6MCT5_EIMMA|nr:hypothetical protein, conserved [Eimeria maxima]CDJ61841.1 hypothetical protein, conserved [Eimeria maxima]
MFPHNSVSPLLPSKRKAPSEEQQQQQQQQQQFSVSLPVAPLETHHLYRQLFSQQQQQQQVLQHRSDLQIVQSLLEGCPLRVSAAELVNEKLGARALRLDDSRRQQRQRQQQQQQQQQKQKQQQLKLSRTQAKRLGLFDVAAEFGCCSSRNRRRQQQQQQQQQGLGLQDLLPLFDLWQQYALSVCGIESSAAAAAASGSSSSSNSNSSGKSRKQKGGLPGGPQGALGFKMH